MRNRRRILITIFAAIMIVAGLAACGDGASQTPGGSASPPTSTSTAGAPSESPTPIQQAAAVLTPSVKSQPTFTVSPTATETATATPVPESEQPTQPVASPTPESSQLAAPTQAPAADSPVPTVAPAPIPAGVGNPLRLKIPSLGVDAAIEYVDVDAEGNMGVPQDYFDVAWFAPGPKPGAPGNAVIAGHLDSKTGPAVFWDLRNLQPGDEIIVTTDTGTEHHFVVQGLEQYPADEAPTAKVFGPTFKTNLNLVTCDGVFDHGVGQYDKRLVVYTTQVPG